MINKNFIQRYQDIISIPSISAFDARLDQSNQPMIHYLAEQCERLGASIAIHPVPVPSGSAASGKFNMLATFGRGEGGLLLAGHSDTVPFDEGRWQSDPFTLKQTDDRLYGLGSCDMKGFFAFVLSALECLPLHKLHKPVYILATADEETSMAGARFFAQQQLIRPDMAIIGEPTELKPIFKHKGHIAHRLDFTGKSGHSSDPAAGINAMEMLHQAIGVLLDYKQALMQPQDDSFAVPHSTLNLGHVAGGDAENRICGHCHMTFDVRPLPGLDSQAMIEDIDRVLAPVYLKWPGRVTRQLLYPPSPAFGCRDEHNIIALAEQLTGQTAASANYATEAPFISALGCDTLVLGPGSIKQAHQPDEFIELKYYQPTISLIQGLVNHLCL